MSFEINNDLNKITPSKHNVLGHFCMTLIIASCAPLYSFMGDSGIMVSLSGFIVAYGLYFAWEVGDGFKPWYYDYKPKYGGDWRDSLRENLLYSDKFSLQDIFIWNLSGSLVGSIIAFLVK